MSVTAGKHGGRFAFGVITNRKDDPTQSGMVQVAWDSGSAINERVDKPWHPVMGGTTNPSLKGVGGPHTGIQEGTRVIGVPLDASGQEFLVIGTMVRPGKGGPDQNAVPDSEVPAHAKVQSNGGMKQPMYGDRNGVVTNESITKFGEQQGGFKGEPAKWAHLEDSIGTFDKVIA